MGAISDADVRRVAELARIAVGDDDVQVLAQQLGSILDHAAQLDSLDLSAVEPTFHTSEVVSALRDDEPQPCLPHADVASAAPQVEDGAVVVPRVHESGR